MIKSSNHLAYQGSSAFLKKLSIGEAPIHTGNDIESSSPQITFGVLDARILGPALFNFYVCDMQAMS